MLGNALSRTVLRVAPRALAGPARVSLPLLERPFLGLRTCAQGQPPKAAAPEQKAANNDKQDNDKQDNDSKGDDKPQQERPRPVRGGPMTWPAVAAFVTVGGAILYAFNNEQEKRKKELEAPRKMRSVGKPLLGGPFTLVDTAGRPVTDEAFKGKFMLIYFGFTFCPDVCPDELEKIAGAYDDLEASAETRGQLVPVFITIDPERDSLDMIREYLAEFHPAFVGLSGTLQQVEAACKGYRVYLSKGPVGEAGDYLVDHTIISYLVGPDGNFVEFYTKATPREEMVARVRDQMRQVAQQAN